LDYSDTADEERRAAQGTTLEALHPVGGFEIIARKAASDPILVDPYGRGAALVTIESRDVLY
jgi:hypothetical protein